MHRASNPNLQIMEIAVARLGTLAEEMVFLGGCATGLLITDAVAPPIRATKDVDVIAEVASLSEYHYLSKRLREFGFSEDQSPDAPICRWQAGGILLDVMPTHPEILGFGNEWYQPAFDAALWRELPSGKKIRMVSAPYFLATKLAAFEGRGRGDYMMSHDMEDIVAVLDGRPEIVEDVLSCEQKLRDHLQFRLAALVGDERFVDALPGHMPGDEGSQARVPIILQRMKAMFVGKPIPL
jgi:predicted nucleotidyltransferase